MSGEIYPGSVEVSSDQETYRTVFKQIDEQVVALETLRTASVELEVAEYERKIGIDTAADPTVWHSGPRIRQCLGYVSIDGIGICPAAIYRIGDGVPQMYIRTPDGVSSRFGNHLDRSEDLEGAQYMLGSLEDLQRILEVYPTLRRLDRQLEDITELPSTLAV